MPLGKDIRKGVGRFGKGFLAGQLESEKEDRFLRRFEQRERIRSVLRPKAPKFDESIRAARKGQISFEDVQEQFPTKDVEKTRFKLDVLDAKRGDVDWSALLERYPDKRTEIDEIHKAATPIKKSKTFREGKGLEALFSKDVAKVSPLVKEFTDAVKNEADYKNALTYMMKEANKRDGEFTKNDINTFLEFFGRR